MGKYNYFINTYNYEWRDYEHLRALKLNLNGGVSNTVSFRIPTLICQGCPNSNTYEDLFEMNTITRVYEIDSITGQKNLVLEKKSGPSSLQDASTSAHCISNNKAYLREIEIWNTNDGDKKDTFAKHYKPNVYSIAHAESNFSDKNVSFETKVLSADEMATGKSYIYQISIEADPDYSGTITSFYQYIADASEVIDAVGLFTVTHLEVYHRDDTAEIVSPKDLKIEFTFYVSDMSENAVGGPMLMKGIKYSCYDLLRKALLTTDTQIIDNEKVGLDTIEYPIVIGKGEGDYGNQDWQYRLKVAKVNETILESKNLWEVLLQIGYYLHAIPYLEFARDGSDRLILNFKQLGGTKSNNDNSSKITVFNSKNLNDYFSQYDSYVTNIFSPQNLIDEYLVIKTNDNSALISNNTAVLKTAYNISEIVEFEIIYDGSCGGESGVKDALSHIFEKSIYQILTADYNISPGMADSLYYELGKNEINGLNYVPPSKNPGDTVMALKMIVARLFKGVNVNDLKFNNLSFHIKYRTQDSMRVSQVRPDIEKFIKNSSYEKYPHNEQYYGQQDKIVDSERFSLNLFGKLVRVGNDLYQRQECPYSNNDEKESGELVMINESPFYVTSIENEFYPDDTYQKVTYSKNYNQLSNIVTIPSEPRFYEVSERSKIRREVRMFDFLKISSVENSFNKVPRYLSKQKWMAFVESLIFNKKSNSYNVDLPNYAWTRFKGDKKRIHRGSYNQYVANSQLFPSSELDRSDPNQVIPKASSDHSDTIVPLLHFPLKDGIMFEWDMEDNFKAGDAVDVSISGKQDVADDAAQSVRYCDIMGRADLFTFKLFKKDDWNHEQAQQLPKACVEPSEADSMFYIPSNLSVALDKDCRCELSFNLQVTLLHKDDDNTGDFVTFSNMFGNKTNQLKCCLLDSNVSMFNENADIIDASVLKDNLGYKFIENQEKQQIEIVFDEPAGIDVSKVKALVFYDVDKDGNKVSYLAKNFIYPVTKLPKLFIYPVFND